jgi:hypothetical protein
VELFLLRTVYSSHPLLTRLALYFALFMALQWLLSWRRNGDPVARLGRQRDLALMLGALGLALVLTATGFQGRTTRQGQLELAASAPIRVSYGDPAAAPTIRVFTARGCGPCRNLEGQLRQIMHEGYAVQYIPGSLDDQDWNLVATAVCGADSGSASGAGFEAAFSLPPDAQAPVTGAVCGGTVGGNEAIQRRLSGHLLYPTLVMPDGLLIVGSPSLDYLRRYLRTAAPLPGQPS